MGVSRFALLSQTVYYQVFDLIVVFFSIVASYQMYRVLEIGKGVFYTNSEIILVSSACSLVTVIVMTFTGTYTKESGVLNSREIQNTLRGVTLSFFLFILIFYFGKIELSRYVIMFSYVMSAVLLVTGKILIYYHHPFQFLLKKFQKKILIYGAGEIGTTLFRHIVDSPRLNLVPVGFIDDNPDKQNTLIRSCGFRNKIKTIPVLGPYSDIEKIVRNHEIEAVYIAVSNMTDDRLMETILRLENMNLNVWFVPNLYKFYLHKIKVGRIGQVPVISKDYDEHLKYEFLLKTGFDFLVSLILLLVLSPLFAVIAMMIRTDTPGPVFFRQTRIGRHGKPFTIYKFRTMHTDADPYAVNPTSGTDARITTTGRILRKTSLDELPQLINVLKGDMSLVGPRPEMEFIVRQYNEVHRERLKVKPGITGLWQLSGDRMVAIHENMEYDLYYVKKWSFFLDIAILFKTAVFAFKGL